MDHFERLLWWLFAGSTGAANRARVLMALRERPQNTQQLAESLRVDYTTARHHLRVLLKNGLVVAEGEGYGRMFFVSSMAESNWGRFVAILEKTGRRNRGGVNHAT